MFQSDLSYIKSQLAAYKHARWAEVAKETGINLRTIKRIAYEETPYPRSDTVGKLAIFFKTKEKRRK